MLWLCCLLIVLLWPLDSYGEAEDSLQQQTIEVAKLSTRVYGTELVLVDEAFAKQKTYKLEDFFWSGSGDGGDDQYDYDSLWGTESPPTIYKTKTIVSTIYLETIPGSDNSTTCCSPVTSATTEEINPTRTLTDEEEEFFDADRQFWLLTVLKSDGKDPVIIDLKNSLAKLYKTAFQRHQQKHLGLASSPSRERRQATPEDPVRVYIHNISKINGSEEKVQVLYHVAIGGRPVDAETAAQDMRLVSDDEVQNELGYPFVIKAEPYLKSKSEPQSLAKSKNTWIFIGGTLIIALVLLLIVAFITLGFTKCKRQGIASHPSQQGIENRQQAYDNKGAYIDTPTYINFREQGNQTVDLRPASCSLSSSSSSRDISPLMLLKKHRTPPKKTPRPKAALQKQSVKIAPELFDSDNSDPGIVSPKSYLSMPSVRSFPRGAMPEPLNKVLEPVSMLHLDMPDGNYDYNDDDDDVDDDNAPNLLRYGSVGTVQDPGVIGPIVWTIHKQKMEHGMSVDEGMNTLKITRMRRRFHDLLDDTFSLFGSRHQTPEQKPKAPILTEQMKSHSAIERNNKDPDGTVQVKPRPKTTDARKIRQHPPKLKPKGAWASTTPSPLVRPLSAPRINTDLILSEGKLKEQDPAVPLIAAIKSEIEKCSLPGSTTDLSHH